MKISCMCTFKLSHVWVQRVEGDIWGVDKRLKEHVGRGQLILSMRLVWRDVRILALRATTPSKRFICF
jgi:hypothetical protein